jgi:hypothetical protein
MMTPWLKSVTMVPIPTTAHHKMRDATTYLARLAMTISIIFWQQLRDIVLYWILLQLS